jgi:acid phosphatase type 7
MLLTTIAAFTLQLSAVSPKAIFTTWDGDPTTTVAIDWHLEAGTDLAALRIRGPGTRGWQSVSGTPIVFPHSDRTVRRARIAGLRPDATYEVRIGNSRTYSYRTMPATLTRPIRFATGGDTQSDDKRFGTTNRMVAAKDVDFVLIGGDLSYSNGDPRLVKREQEWFETITNSLVTPSGRLIPLIAAIGNHEVFSTRDTAATFKKMVDSTGVELGRATYYRALHAHVRDPQYGAIDVGDYLSLFLLNSDHSSPVIGAQTEWLRKSLAQRANVPFAFPVYHVPAYPSVRAFTGTTSARIRQHWVPLFENTGIRLAFENHDHAYKRSVPLRNGQRDSSGVIFMGDGAWGAGPRVIGRDSQNTPEWYLERYESMNHAIFVTLTAGSSRVEVYTSEGTLLDSLTVGGRRMASPPMATAGHR